MLHNYKQWLRKLRFSKKLSNLRKKFNLHGKFIFNCNFIRKLKYFMISIFNLERKLKFSKKKNKHKLQLSVHVHVYINKSVGEKHTLAPLSSLLCLLLSPEARAFSAAVVYICNRPSSSSTIPISGCLIWGTELTVWDLLGPSSSSSPAISWEEKDYKIFKQPKTETKHHSKKREKKVTCKIT